MVTSRDYLHTALPVGMFPVQAPPTQLVPNVQTFDLSESSHGWPTSMSAGQVPLPVDGSLTTQEPAMQRAAGPHGAPGATTVRCAQVFFAVSQ